MGPQVSSSYSGSVFPHASLLCVNYVIRRKIKKIWPGFVMRNIQTGSVHYNPARGRWLFRPKVIWAFRSGKQKLITPAGSPLPK